ncbi:MAG: molybdopterin-dependent oxidoreductase [Pseudomonadota bacterium]
MVTLTVDGVEVSVERGTSILDAAHKAGRRVPTLCHDKRLIPYGACRLCIVEVTQKGKTRTMPACFNPVRDGMQVATHTPKLIEIRQMQLMLLLRSHPLQCPGCDAAGDCRLQDLVYEYRIPDLPFTKEARAYNVDNDSHFIRFNMNLCVRCGMCVRICDELQGVNELSFIKRGWESEVSTDFGRPIDCEFCGQCVQVCPVGAIKSKWLFGTGREFELEKSNTTCSFCSLGCTLSLGRKNGKIVWVTSPDDGHNEGNLCVKGRYGWPYVYSPDRLTKPLVRKDGVLVQVEWDEALAFTATKFNEIKTNVGPLSLAALGSERLTNEEAYVFNRFVRTVLDTSHLDHAGGIGYQALVSGLRPAFGYPATTNSIKELRNAKVILLVGADLTETHPVAKNEVILAVGRIRARVIVVDSVATKLSRRPGISLLGRPGSEHLVLNAMIKEILDAGLYDKRTLDTTDGFVEFSASLDKYTPDAVAELTGIQADLIREAAAEYAKAPTAAIVLTDGINRLGINVPTAQAAANLAVITGRLGKESCGVFVFGEKGNSQGAVDMGLAPDMLPGFQSTGDESARTKFEKVWQGSIPTETGLNAAQILSRAETGEIRGLYVVGENPLDNYPDRAQIERALGKLDLLVVQDMFLSSTAQMAHVVLPVAAFTEKSGTFTSAERMVQRINAVAAPEGAKSDLEVFLALAPLMGKPAMSYTGPEQVMREIGETVEVYRGVSYGRIDGSGLQWPCLGDEDPGKPILYLGGQPIGKTRFQPAPPIIHVPSGEYPMYLISGTQKFHSGTMTQWSGSMLEVCPEAAAEMNRLDMLELGLKDDDRIRITSSRGGSVEVKVKKSLRALRGSVIVPYHFPAVKLNVLTRWDESPVQVKVDKV